MSGWKKHRVPGRTLRKNTLKKKKNRVGKVILKSRLPLIADSQSCLRFACSPQEHQWEEKKNPEMSPDKQTNKKKQRRREGLKPGHQFQQSHSLFTRLGTITKHNFVCERKNLDQLRVVIFFFMCNDQLYFDQYVFSNTYVGVRVRAG